MSCNDLTPRDATHLAAEALSDESLKSIARPFTAAAIASLAVGSPALPKMNMQSDITAKNVM